MKNKNVNYGLLTDAHVLAPEIRASFDEHFEVKDASFARGRFANVRRCVHKPTSAECAAKVMRKYRRAVDVTAEILHEVRILLMADKERHIVNLLQLYESTSEYILVLEMAAGGELQRVLDDCDSIPEANTKILLRQLLNAVVFLHSKNIAHLDIKPQNILLTAPYPNGEVKLCDFGISRLITNDTELREIVGTADYVAPEILNYEPIFLTSDMWSIGILTYVMLTGYTPFGGETKQETYSNITQCILDFPDDLFNGISESAIEFICSLLKKKPRDRLSSSKCLEHEWLVAEEIAEPNQPMQPTDETTARVPNGVVNGAVNGGIINTSISSNMNGSMPPNAPNGNCLNNNNVECKETALNRSSTIDLPPSSPAVVNEPNTGQPSVTETAPDQQPATLVTGLVTSPVTSPVTSLVSDPNDQILVENPVDLNSPAAVQSIGEAVVHSPDCTPGSQQDEALDMQPPAAETQPPTKPSESTKLSSDSDKLSSNPEILIPTSSTTNELITTCTNVTLLTAN